MSTHSTKWNRMTVNEPLRKAINYVKETYYLSGLNSLLTFLNQSKPSILRGGNKQVEKMKRLYNNKNLFDWIVWICLASIGVSWCLGFIFNCIPAWLLIKGSAILLMLTAYSHNRYVFLSNNGVLKELKEYTQLQKEMIALYDENSKLKSIAKNTQDKFYNTTDNIVTPTVDLDDMDVPPFRKIEVSDETKEKIMDIFKKKDDFYYNTTDNVLEQKVDNFQGHNSVQCKNYEKDLDSPISKCKHCGMHEGFHWGKLTNNTKH